MWLGVATNIFLVTVYGYFYGRVCMNNNNGGRETVDQKESDYLISLILLNLSGLVSWSFLGDALRRIWISFKSTRGLLRNEKVMLLHMVIFSVYIVSAFLKIAEMKIYFS